MKSFEKWILANGGAKKTAKKLKITQRTIDKWRTRETRPNKTNIKNLYKVCKNQKLISELLFPTI